MDDERGLRALTLEGLTGSESAASLTHRFEAGRFHVVTGTPVQGDALLALLALTMPPLRGIVRWGDQELTALPPDQQASWRRQTLGLMARNSQLVSVMSVRDHVRMAASIRGQPHAEGEALLLLDLLGMGARLDQRPAALSGSEKQRLALVQALCGRPAIVLAAEPSAALDRTSAALVAHILRSYAREANALVICTSTDQVIIDAADEVVVMA